MVGVGRGSLWDDHGALLSPVSRGSHKNGSSKGGGSHNGGLHNSGSLGRHTTRALYDDNNNSDDGDSGSGSGDDSDSRDDSTSRDDSDDASLAYTPMSASSSSINSSPWRTPKSNCNNNHCNNTHNTSYRYVSSFVRI